MFLHLVHKFLNKIERSLCYGFLKIAFERVESFQDQRYLQRPVWTGYLRTGHGYSKQNQPGCTLRYPWLTWFNPIIFLLASKISFSFWSPSWGLLNNIVTTYLQYFSISFYLHTDLSNRNGYIGYLIIHLKWTLYFFFYDLWTLSVGLIKTLAPHSWISLLFRRK